MRRKNENGQAILLVVVAMGIFLVGALGLAIDGAQLFGNRGMAQVAADAAAQAAILSIYNGTNVGTNAFADTAAYTTDCATSPDITPCRLAQKNGFGTSADVVVIDVPTAAAVGLDPASLAAGSDAVKLIRVKITRHVPTGIIRMLGAANTVDVKAVAVAAMVDVKSSTPMLITHPTRVNALSTTGGSGSLPIKICGGPTKSIQVNSDGSYPSPGVAYNTGGIIDLSQAGPADAGNCVNGTGADFGVLGGPVTNPGAVRLGSTGNYISPASRVQDPLAFVAAPAAPTNAALAPFTVHNSSSPNYGCSLATEPSGCTVLSPGLYVGGLNASGTKINNTIINGGNWIIFQPGLYYMQGGGFTLKNVNGGGGAPDYNAMCTTCTAVGNTGLGMTVYDTGTVGSPTSSGGINIDTLVQATLKGATLTTLNSDGKPVPAAPYYGIVFWENTLADAHTGNGAHILGKGNGCFSLIGTIYLTNTKGIMADPNHYQEVDYNGTPCSTTIQQGDIIVSTLTIVGNTTVSMNLVPWAFFTVRQVALVR